MKITTCPKGVGDAKLRLHDSVSQRDGNSPIPTWDLHEIFVGRMVIFRSVDGDNNKSALRGALSGRASILPETAINSHADQRQVRKTLGLQNIPKSVMNQNILHGEISDRHASAKVPVCATGGLPVSVFYKTTPHPGLFISTRSWIGCFPSVGSPTPSFSNETVLRASLHQLGNPPFLDNTFE